MEKQILLLFILSITTVYNNQRFVELVKRLMKMMLKQENLYLENLVSARGTLRYCISNDESITDEAYVIDGPVVDLFDPQCPVLTKKTIPPGQQALVYNLSRIPNKNQPQVLASASRIYEEIIKLKEYSFISKSPANN